MVPLYTMVVHKDYRCCVLQAILPVAKLCALVTMQRMAGHNTQTFSLPMTLIDKDTQVQYVTLCVSSIEVVPEVGVCTSILPDSTL